MIRPRTVRKHAQRQPAIVPCRISSRHPCMRGSRPRGGRLAISSTGRRRYQRSSSGSSSLRFLDSSKSTTPELRFPRRRVELKGTEGRHQRITATSPTTSPRSCTRGSKRHGGRRAALPHRHCRRSSSESSSRRRADSREAITQARSSHLRRTRLVA